MKKILIATACAFTLCLTSCASKQTPETQSEAQPPVSEIDNAEQTDSKDTTESEENNTEESDTEEALNIPEVNDFVILSEDFPEPENIEEPEIITLEPAEEEVVSNIEEELPSEQVENEEPPLISDIEVIIPSETENNDSEPSETTTENVETTEPAVEDITVVSDSDDDGITAIGGGIDITDEDSTSDEKYNENAKKIVPSRSVTLKKFEYLDVTYPGSGWIYMGLVDNSKDIAYFGRKLGTKDTKFTLQARAAGTKIVHFYRNDPLTGKYLDDYIEIVILSENGSNKTHIEAPEYKLPIIKNETNTKKEAEETDDAVETETAEAEKTNETQKNETKSSSAVTTSTDSKTTTTTPVKDSNTTASANSKTSAVSTTTKTSTANESTAAADSTETTVSAVTESTSLLQEAQVLYNEKEYSAALKKLNQFFEYSTDKRDEALYLKGQILEAKSDVRDIKGAIDAYTTLTKNYPASNLWDSANKRIIYLKRFYLEVR